MAKNIMNEIRMAVTIDKAQALNDVREILEKIEGGEEKFGLDDKLKKELQDMIKSVEEAVKKINDSTSKIDLNKIFEECSLTADQLTDSITKLVANLDKIGGSADKLSTVVDDIDSLKEKIDNIDSNTSLFDNLKKKMKEVNEIINKNTKDLEQMSSEKKWTQNGSIGKATQDTMTKKTKETASLIKQLTEMTSLYNNLAGDNVDIISNDKIKKANTELNKIVKTTSFLNEIFNKSKNAQKTGDKQEEADKAKIKKAEELIEKYKQEEEELKKLEKIYEKNKELALNDKKVKKPRITKKTNFDTLQEAVNSYKELNEQVRKTDVGTDEWNTLMNQLDESRRKVVALHDTMEEKGLFEDGENKKKVNDLWNRDLREQLSLQNQLSKSKDNIASKTEKLLDLEVAYRRITGKSIKETTADTLVPVVKTQENSQAIDTKNNSSSTAEVYWNKACENLKKYIELLKEKDAINSDRMEDEAEGDGGEDLSPERIKELLKKYKVKKRENLNGKLSNLILDKDKEAEKIANIINSDLEKYKKLGGTKKMFTGISGVGSEISIKPILNENSNLKDTIEYLEKIKKINLENILLEEKKNELSKISNDSAFDTERYEEIRYQYDETNKILKEFRQQFHNTQIELSNGKKLDTIDYINDNTENSQIVNFSSNKVNINDSPINNEELQKRIELLNQIQQETEDITLTLKQIDKYNNINMEDKDYEELSASMKTIVDIAEEAEHYIEELQGTYKSFLITLKDGKQIAVDSLEGLNFVNTGDYSNVKSIDYEYTDEKKQEIELEKQIEALDKKQEALENIEVKIRSLINGEDLYMNNDDKNSTLDSFIKDCDISQDKAETLVNSLYEISQAFDKFGDDTLYNPEFSKIFDELRQKVSNVFKGVGEEIKGEMISSISSIKQIDNAFDDKEYLSGINKFDATSENSITPYTKSKQESLRDINELYEEIYDKIKKIQEIEKSETHVADEKYDTIAIKYGINRISEDVEPQQIKDLLKDMSIAKSERRIQSLSGENTEKSDKQIEKYKNAVIGNISVFKEQLEKEGKDVQEEFKKIFTPGELRTINSKEFKSKLQEIADAGEECYNEFVNNRPFEDLVDDTREDLANLVYELKKNGQIIKEQYEELFDIINLRDGDIPSRLKDALKMNPTQVQTEQPVPEQPEEQKPADTENQVKAEEEKQEATKKTNEQIEEQNKLVERNAELERQRKQAEEEASKEAERKRQKEIQAQKELKKQKEDANRLAQTRSKFSEYSTPDADNVQDSFNQRISEITSSMPVDAVNTKIIVDEDGAISGKLQYINKLTKQTITENYKWHYANEELEDDYDRLIHVSTQFSDKEIDRIEAQKRAQEQLNATKTKYESKLSGVNTEFSNLQEYKEVENAISDLPKTDDKVAGINRIDVAFNNLNKVINEYKQNVKNSASLDPVASSLKQLDNVDNIILGLQQSFEKMGYSTKDARKQLQELFKTSSLMKKLDSKSDNGMVKLGEYTKQFNTELDRVKNKLPIIKGQLEIDARNQKSIIGKQSKDDIEDRIRTSLTDQDINFDTVEVKKDGKVIIQVLEEIDGYIKNVKYEANSIGDLFDENGILSFNEATKSSRIKRSTSDAGTKDTSKVENTIKDKMARINKILESELMKIATTTESSSFKDSSKQEGLKTDYANLKADIEAANTSGTELNDVMVNGFLRQAQAIDETRKKLMSTSNLTREFANSQNATNSKVTSFLNQIKTFQNTKMYKMEPEQLIDPRSTEVAKVALISLFEEVSSKTEISKNELDEYKTKYNELRNTIKEGSKASNWKKNAQGEHQDFLPNLDNMQEDVKEYVRSLNLGNVEYGKWNKNTLTFSTRNGKNIEKYAISVDEATRSIRLLKKSEEEYQSFGSKFISGIGKKIGEISKYVISMASVYEVINFFKQGVGIIRDFDKEMTELRKVSDETSQTLKNFGDESFEIANRVSSTGKQIVSSTADWQRLGKSLSDSKILAENTAVLMNVSEFDSIDTATEAMVSMTQAFDVSAEESMGLIDSLNTIGNNYSISTDKLATGLQDSASALVAANNSLEESEALMVAGNSTVQDSAKTSAGKKLCLNT